MTARGVFDHARLPGNGLIKKGKFPQPVQLTDKAVGWLASEVQDWLNYRPKV